MTHSEKISKKKTFRQRDNDEKHGKIRYRVRKQQEKEAVILVKEFRNSGKEFKKG